MTKIYRITGKPKSLHPGTQEQELCDFHAERWAHAGYQLTQIERRTTPAYKGDDCLPDGELCEWCEQEPEA